MRCCLYLIYTWSSAVRGINRLLLEQKVFPGISEYAPLPWGDLSLPSYKMHWCSDVVLIGRKGNGYDRGPKVIQLSIIGEDQLQWVKSFREVSPLLMNFSSGNPWDFSETQSDSCLTNDNNLSAVVKHAVMSLYNIKHVNNSNATPQPNSLWRSLSGFSALSS